MTTVEVGIKYKASAEQSSVSSGKCAWGVLFFCYDRITQGICC